MAFSRLGLLGVIITLAALGTGPFRTVAGGAGAAKHKEQAGFLIVAGEESQSRFGDLSQTGLSEDSHTRSVSHAIPYYPEAGDIFLYDDLVPWHHLLFRLAGTGPPTHAAIAVEQADHKVVLLELTGPTFIKAKVVFLEIEPRLKSYEGNVMVRTLREPLTEEQSASLSHFAEAQEGKNIALKRGLLQGTPFRCRSGLRQQLFAHTYIDRKRWFCSEMVVAACCAGHFLDPQVYRANAMYPRDLAFDENYDLSGLYRKALPWTAERPARAKEETAMR
jgi:hypothetical protein